MQLSCVLRAGQLVGYRVLHNLGAIWGTSLTNMSLAREAGALATNQLKTSVFLLKAKAGVLPGPCQLHPSVFWLVLWFLIFEAKNKEVPSLIPFVAQTFDIFC